MSDDRDGAGRSDREAAVSDGGRETPNMGDYRHEPAVDPDDDGPERPRPAETERGVETAGGAENRSATAARGNGNGEAATEAVGGETAVGGTDPTAAAGHPTGTVRGGRGGAPHSRGDQRPAGGPGATQESGSAGQGATGPAQGAAAPAQDPFAAPDEVDVWTRVGAAVSQGGVRATAAGVAGAYLLVGAGFALLAILVGGLGLPVLETTWETYPLVAEGALLTAVPTAALLLALFAGGYATLRHGGVDAVVAGSVGAGVGTAVATALSVGAVGLVAGSATVILGGVLVDLLLLGVVAGLVAAGTTLVATRLGLSGDAIPTTGADAADAEDD